MSKSKTYTVGFKRKRKKKTDYRKRLKLVISDKTRLVMRQTTNNIIIQAVTFSEKGDKVIKTVKSSDLRKYDWKENTGNTQAAYLTGLLFGNLTKDSVKEGIVDLGLRRLVKGSRLAAAIKGVIDSGIEVPASESIFPSEERIKGIGKTKDLSTQFEATKKKIENKK